LIKLWVLFSSEMFAAKKFSVPNIKVEVLGKGVCLPAKRQLLLCDVALNQTNSKLFFFCTKFREILLNNCLVRKNM